MTNTQRVAIVTGAARGLGAATAERLAADGLAVAVVDLNKDLAAVTAKQLDASGCRSLAIGADITDRAEADAAVAEVAAELGPPTVLVNNAGITRDNLLFRMSDDDWDAVMDVHLRGSFHMTRATQAHMVQASYGRIVNLSSTSALGNRGQVNYATAKAGIQGFTKTLAIELGKFGITTNSVAPGFIHTDMNRAVAERLNVPWEDYSASLVERIPVGRAGQPADVANLVSFFVSESAGFVNGQVIYVSGGPET